AFERVFNEMFAGLITPPGQKVTAPQQNLLAESAEPAAGEEGDSRAAPGELPPGLPGLDEALAPSGTGEEPDPDDGTPAEDGRPAVKRVASLTERLRGKDFAQLSPSELAQLATLMRDLVIAVPPRRTRRYRARKDGPRLDMRRTMRLATRTGGEPVRIARRAVRVRQRRLVVLCDISGSMEPYARAILQLMYVAARNAGAAGGGGPGFTGPSGDASRPRTEVFTFATRLTRLTPFLAAASPETMLAKAGEAAPDWAGGTRIGATLREFNDRYAVRGMGRGAVILIISDGWETGDPALLGAQMARLHRIAYRIVWANPRTQSERYRPEVGGMAAAWPYCDAVVSAHNFEALDDLLAALRAPRAARAPFVPPAVGTGPSGPNQPIAATSSSTLL
ncbi:MAG TPA: VWA domain-containing protein, partial [Trebonia sp.]|nr:VWA domain-containing protein [Trebonia sp.]